MTEPLSLDVHDQMVSGRVARPTTSSPHEPGPLLVALHGGGFTSEYFDAGSQSFLSAAAAAGYTAIAIDRPGYGGSSPLPEGEHGIARGAAHLDRVIAALWDEYGVDHTGVVLVGHSIGSITALMIAGSSPLWPLVGVAVSGVGLGLPPLPRYWEEREPGEWVATPLESMRQLMFGEDGSYPTDAPAAMHAIARPVWWRELIESYTSWVADGPDILGSIRVPVHVRQGDHDILFPQGADELERFASRFTAADSVDASLLPESGHCIDFHLTGERLHREQLGFAQWASGRSRD